MTSRKPSKEDVEKGCEIVRLRRKRDLSQAALGQMIGKSGSQISKYELGKNRMAATIYEQLIAVLDPKPLPTGFAEGQTAYGAPIRRREEERQFLKRMMNELQRRMDELGGM